MANVARQPFAPLNEARLKSLTSMKNRQNALPNTSPSKRKVSDATESFDSENVDPLLFKRAKSTDRSVASKSASAKSSASPLSKSASVNDVHSSTSRPLKAATPRSRNLSNSKSPSAKFAISSTRSSPLSAPSGRTPSRGKRPSILSSRRHTGSSFTRVDPPSFGPTPRSATPLSLDAAIKGTFTGNASRRSTSSSKKSSILSSYSGLHEPEMNSSWFFDIHEDTEEQEMTNLLQHSTCVLDISSDEESESRRQQEHMEGKENIPPADDISQTSRPRAARYTANDADEIAIEKKRSPLGEMDPRAYYSEGCDENSIVFILDDEDEEVTVLHKSQSAPEILVASTKSKSELDHSAESLSTEEEKLVPEADKPAPGAVVLAPIEGTGESFEVWESSSAKDEAEAATEL